MRDFLLMVGSKAKRLIGVADVESLQRLEPVQQAARYGIPHRRTSKSRGEPKNTSIDSDSSQGRNPFTILGLVRV